MFALCSGCAETSCVLMMMVRRVQSYIGTFICVCVWQTTGQQDSRLLMVIIDGKFPPFVLKT